MRYSLIKKLIFFIGILLGFYFILPSTSLWQVLNDNMRWFFSQVCSCILNPLGFNTIACSGYNDYYISSSSLNLHIINECTGLFAILIVNSFILILPIPIKHKIYGIIIMTPFIILINLVRITSVFIVSTYSLSVGDFVHTYIWRVLYVVLIGIVYFVYMSWCTSRSPRGENSGDTIPNR
jgi:exosortase/archaeosortase family protein